MQKAVSNGIINSLIMVVRERLPVAHEDQRDEPIRAFSYRTIDGVFLGLWIVRR